MQNGDKGWPRIIFGCSRYLVKMLITHNVMVYFNQILDANIFYIIETQVSKTVIRLCQECIFYDKA